MIGALAAAPVCLIIWTSRLYPLATWTVIADILAYSAALWRWPAAFLLILPVILPACDLGMWTGWLAVSDSDLFVLATLAVLLVRVPPARADLVCPRPVAITLGLLVATLAVSTGISLLSSHGFISHSDNPFLRPDNALYLAKGYLEALVLLPFLRQRQRTHGDALRWLAWGMVAGLVAVTAEVLAERALFTGIFDFSTDYRVVAAFSSMRVGGGHIGAYLALALPFVMAAGFRSRPLLALPVLALAALGGGYSVVVTYARTGYMACAAGLMATGFCRVLAGSAPHRARLALVPVVLILAGVAAAASFSVMRERLLSAAEDLVTREGNWRAGWAVRDTDIGTTLFGMGLGSYQRTMLARSQVNQPSDLELGEDGSGRFVTLRTHTPFYFGQKITPPEREAKVTLRFRAETAGTTLNVILCDKMLVYSDNCRGAQVTPQAPGTWEAAALTLPADGLGSTRLGGLLRRPVEFSVFAPANAGALGFREVRVVDGGGRSLLVNGDFAHGLDRWLFTDDSHVSWRILNVYLMQVFETGVLGLGALLAVVGMALAGAARAVRRGDPMGGAVIGSILSFLVSGMFDAVLEAPRLTTLFLLVCCAGLMLWEERPAQNRSISPIASAPVAWRA